MRLRNVIAAFMIWAAGPWLTGVAAATQERARPPAERRAQWPSRGAVERFLRMSPQQRQRALARLSPERRHALQQRLEQLDQLTPEQKQRLRERYQRFRGLSAARQNALRSLYRRLNRLAPERRRLVAREYRRLARLAPEQRKQQLASEQLHHSFSAEERELLEELVANAPEPE